MWEDRWWRGGLIAALLFIGIAILIAGHHDPRPQWPPFMADGPAGQFPPPPMWGGAGGYGAYGGGSGPYGGGRPPMAPFPPSAESSTSARVISTRRRSPPDSKSRPSARACNSSFIFGDRC